MLWGGREQAGGVIPLPPPPLTKVTIVGKNDIYHWKHLVGPVLVHKLLGSSPPPPPSDTNTSLGKGVFGEVMGGLSVAALDRC